MPLPMVAGSLHRLDELIVSYTALDCSLLRAGTFLLLRLLI